MKIGKSYIASYTIDGLRQDGPDNMMTRSNTNVVTTPIVPGNSFIVVEESRREGENWYRVLAPDALGWLFLFEGQDFILDKDGFVALDKVRTLTEVAVPK